MNILVCDDDKEIVEAISIYLKNDGYNVIKTYNGYEAIKALETEDIQLIIMDIMMPKLDGIQATTRIRETKNVPIIMVSAKAEDIDKIMGLNMGADDYITKPFNPLELLARVKSQLRRYTNLGAMTPNTNKFINGGLIIDDNSKQVTLDGDEIKLTPIEYNILKLLVKNAGRVYSIDQIYENVWNEPALNPENTVAVHIRRIRQKIEINSKNPKYLKVVWGVGYKVEKY
ncbi:response regulator transcription factor [Clostridium sp. 'deep sea']|uniref:response regulator transcription factor n=1 Tax=Clostridium sp. 'deep sea' TaxID=2779445 RepID=UPI001896A148|nr:response regulator transcription factor [Clostridium sp. 'deep sea']QOR36683.1 response regulator transcription factor [Clostridium sp. 'deep sea']